MCRADPDRAAIVHPVTRFCRSSTLPIIAGDVDHEAYCLQLGQGSRNIASFQTRHGTTTRTMTMTLHILNAVALTAVTVFLVNRAFALYDLINAATVSEHI